MKEANSQASKNTLVHHLWARPGGGGSIWTEPSMTRREAGRQRDRINEMHVIKYGWSKKYSEASNEVREVVTKCLIMKRYHINQ